MAQDTKGRGFLGASSIHSSERVLAGTMQQPSLPGHKARQSRSCSQQRLYPPQNTKSTAVLPWPTSTSQLGHCALWEWDI